MIVAPLQYWRHDTQHNDFQHNCTRTAMLSFIVLNVIYPECCYAECHLSRVLLCWMSLCWMSWRLSTPLSRLGWQCLPGTNTLPVFLQDHWRRKGFMSMTPALLPELAFQGPDKNMTSHPVCQNGKNLFPVKSQEFEKLERSGRRRALFLERNMIWEVSPKIIFSWNFKTWKMQKNSDIMKKVKASVIFL